MSSDYAKLLDRYQLVTVFINKSQTIKNVTLARGGHLSPEAFERELESRVKEGFLPVGRICSTEGFAQSETEVFPGGPLEPASSARLLAVERDSLVIKLETVMKSKAAGG